MKLTGEQVQRVAGLARVEITETEKEKFADEISAVLGYIGQLQEADTKNIPATNQVTGVINVTREDIVEGCDEETRKKILAGAPMREGDYIKVKAVL
jgi:aspartyl-tRNA(Asn)/glutamyl-tRNA(Gln) amidotransferase subunit C